MATATLNWVASPAAENVLSYTIEQHNGVSWSAIGSTASTAFTTGVLTPGVPYQWRIRAVNAAGASEPSDPVPLPVPPSKPATPSVVLNP